MNFKTFILASEFRNICNGPEKSYFNKAVNYGDKFKHEVHHHRQWVRDVIECFSDRMLLTKGQAIQMLTSGNILVGQRIHARAVEKLPHTVKDGFGKDIPNPLRKELLDLSTLGATEYSSLVRRTFDTAIGIRHPLKVVQDRGTGDSQDKMKGKVFETVLLVGLAQAITQKQKHPS